MVACSVGRRRQQASAHAVHGCALAAHHAQRVVGLGVGERHEGGEHLGQRRAGSHERRAVDVVGEAELFAQRGQGGDEIVLAHDGHAQQDVQHAEEVPKGAELRQQRRRFRARRKRNDAERGAAGPRGALRASSRARRVPCSPTAPAARAGVACRRAARQKSGHSPEPLDTGPGETATPAACPGAADASRRGGRCSCRRCGVPHLLQRRELAQQLPARPHVQLGQPVAEGRAPASLAQQAGQDGRNQQRKRVRAAPARVARVVQRHGGLQSAGKSCSGGFAARLATHGGAGAHARRRQRRKRKGAATSCAWRPPAPGPSGCFRSLPPTGRTAQRARAYAPSDAAVRADRTRVRCAPPPPAARRDGSRRRRGAAAHRFRHRQRQEAGRGAFRDARACAHAASRVR